MEWMATMVYKMFIRSGSGYLNGGSMAELCSVVGAGFVVVCAAIVEFSK